MYTLFLFLICISMNILTMDNEEKFISVQDALNEIYDYYNKYESQELCQESDGEYICFSNGVGLNHKERKYSADFMLEKKAAAGYQLITKYYELTLKMGSDLKLINIGDHPHSLDLAWFIPESGKKKVYRKFICESNESDESDEESDELLDEIQIKIE